MTRITALLIVATLALGLAAAKIKIHRDPAFDFAPAKTWAWNPEAAGHVRMVTSKDAQPETVQRKYEPTLMKAVEDGFAAKGYTQATGYAPNLVATYHLLITVGNSSQALGDFLPANAGWGLPPFTPATTFFEVYPVGTLVVDVGSGSADKLVWRGIAEAKIEIDNSEEKRASRIKSVVKDLLAKFPKAGTK